MDEISTKRGYLLGVLILLGLFVFGILANPVLGSLGVARLLWPQNLYFILIACGLGMAVGLISNSAFVERVSKLSVLLPSLLFLLLLGGVFLIEPQGVEIPYFKRILKMPLLLIVLFVFLVGGVRLPKCLKDIRQCWAELALLLAMMLFVFSTSIGHRDYYLLQMRIGEDRALFEAQDASGKFYRLPFAIKLIQSDEGADDSLKMRVFDTVSDYEDVFLTNISVFKTKGWKVSVLTNDEQVLRELKFAILQLEFDRWIELKFISAVLLLLAFGLYLRFKC